MTAKILGPIGHQFLEARGVSPETAVRYGIFTARNTKGGVIADGAGNVLVFPYFEREAVVNEKYRGEPKKFWQSPGGKRTFWNSDALDDPALIDGRMALVITEGEMDALTAIDCGFPLSVSVPDGAPPVRDGDDPDDVVPIDAATDAKSKFEFVWNNRERLKKIKRFILAVDSDRPGQRLAAELRRRLFDSRCSFVTYPTGCKDLNEVLMKHGPEAVALTLNEAKPYPVRGLYRLGDYQEQEALRTYSTGWATLDQNLKLFAGEFMVITGIPSDGKSTWLMNLLTNAANLHGWRTALFSPEMPTVPHLRDKLRRIKSGRGGEAARSPEIDAWIEQHFVFIGSDPTGEDDDEFNLDWLLDRATDAVLRDNIQVLAIDPWNEIEHARQRDESVTDYVGRSIRALKRFARLRNVMVIIVAHPTKEVGKDGKHRVPTLYDVESSAHWYNKCDHGIVIERPDPVGDTCSVWIAKSRFEEAGERGKVNFRYDRINARYVALNEPDEPALA